MEIKRTENLSLSTEINKIALFLRKNVPAKGEAPATPSMSATIEKIGQLFHRISRETE
jgi:hypothetical protein